MQFHELPKMSVIDRAFPAKGVYTFFLFDSLFKNFIIEVLLPRFILLTKYEIFIL